jgi:hypothetical protein
VIKNPGRIDLHMHSIHSDGEHTPFELVEMADAAGVSAIALTDHDTVAGLFELKTAAQGTGLETVSGVELSSSAGSSELHILGYFIDPNDARLTQALELFRVQRRERIREIVGKLNPLGVDITMEDVERQARGSALGRPHVAHALLELGYVEAFDEAFRRYLGHHGPAFVPKPHFEPAKALRLVQEARGASVLAHPGTAGRDDLIPELAEAGLKGIEVWHPKHTPFQVEQYRRLARKNGLVTTGGSDFHGAAMGAVFVGMCDVPFSVLEELRSRL